MSDSAITFTVLAAAVVLFASNRVPVGIVAIGAALALYATDVLGLEQALAGFGDPTVIFIAALFVVSEALDSTGVTTWAGQRLVAASGASRTRLGVLLLVLVALLSAVISVNGAVAALVPMTVVVALRIGRSPSRLLMPLAFAAHAGSLLALTGTPVNVLVSDAAAESGGGRFGFLEFALAGLPLVAGTIAIAVLLGPRVLPDRRARSMPADLSTHARTLLEQYAVDRARHAAPATLFTRRAGAAEVVIPPRSELIGERMFPGMVTSSGDLIVLAIQRGGEDREGETALRAGDTLLVEGEWAALDRELEDPGVLVVDPPEAVRRQAVPMGAGAKRALAVLAGMVVLLATGAVPPVVAGLLAACAVVLLGALGVEDAYRAISWTTIVLIAGMIPVSTAIQETGAADDVAGVLIDVVGGAGPHVLLLGLFVITALFGQLISNTATALIMIPVGIAAAAELDVSARPVLMSLAVASAAAFLTPIATPANLMILGPGGYRFGDYWKLGLPLLVLFGAVAVLLVPLIWRF
jgi:di/tricarboxylate transporter